MWSKSVELLGSTKTRRSWNPTILSDKTRVWHDYHPGGQKNLPYLQILLSLRQKSIVLCQHSLYHLLLGSFLNDGALTLNVDPQVLLEWREWLARSHQAEPRQQQLTRYSRWSAIHFSWHTRRASWFSPCTSTRKGRCQHSSVVCLCSLWYSQCQVWSYCTRSPLRAKGHLKPGRLLIMGSNYLYVKLSGVHR